MLEGLTPPVNRVLFCKVDLILRELDENDARILTEALADTVNWGHSPLARALKARGVDLSDTTIAKHRAGECRCDK